MSNDLSSSECEVLGNVVPNVLLLGFMSVILSDMDVCDTMSKNQYSLELHPNHSNLMRIHRELFVSTQYAALGIGPQFAEVEVPSKEREKFYELVFELNKPPYSLSLPLHA